MESGRDGGGAVSSYVLLLTFVNAWEHRELRRAGLVELDHVFVPGGPTNAQLRVSLDRPSIVKNWRLRGWRGARRPERRR